MILFYADIHGYFHDFIKVYNEYKDLVDTVILLGDQCPDEPLDNIFSRIDCSVFFVLGNHDSDRQRWLTNHFPVWNNHIHCRIVESAGHIKIAGLSGVFREDIWIPTQQYPPYFPTREQYRYYFKARSKKNPNFWLIDNYLPKKHWSTIFPEDIDRLLELEADILVCHEAPSSHEYGFEVVDEIAEAMGLASLCMVIITQITDLEVKAGLM